MRLNALFVLSMLALAACGADDTEAARRDSQSFRVYVDNVSDPVILARALGVPSEEIATLNGVRADRRIGEPPLHFWAQVVSWRDYRRLDTAQFRPGTAGELLEFSLQHPDVMNDRVGVCAPGTRLQNGYVVLSRGNRLGVWQNNCKWAIVIEKA